MKLRQLKDPYEILDAAAQKQRVERYRADRLQDLTEAAEAVTAKAKARAKKTSDSAARRVAKKASPIPDEIKRLAELLGMSPRKLLAVQRAQRIGAAPEEADGDDD